MDYYLPVICGTMVLLGSSVLPAVKPIPADTRWDFSTLIDHNSNHPTRLSHNRNHHHRNRTLTVTGRQTHKRTTPSLFSRNFFFHLQAHLGLRLETTVRPVRLVDKLRQRSAIGPDLTLDTMDELLPMGYPWQQNSHVPFRYRYKYSSYFHAPKAQPEDPSVSGTRDVDPCMLARWNYELPFSELPNMVAGLLSTDMLSGETTAAKARFMSELLHLSLESYRQLESSSGDVFEIPMGFDLAKCNLKKSDPLLTSVNHLLNLYSEKALTMELLLGLIQAAKACLGKEDKPFPLELLPCLDFSFGSEQVLRQPIHRSIFSNDDICRRYLSPNIRDCVPLEKHPCNADHIESLNRFARQFYQCPDLTGIRPGADHEGSPPDAQHATDEDDFTSAGSPIQHQHDQRQKQSLTLILVLILVLPSTLPLY